MTVQTPDLWVIDLYSFKSGSWMPVTDMLRLQVRWEVSTLEKITDWPKIALRLAIAHSAP